MFVDEQCLFVRVDGDGLLLGERHVEMVDNGSIISEHCISEMRWTAEQVCLLGEGMFALEVKSTCRIGGNEQCSLSLRTL